MSCWHGLTRASATCAQGNLLDDKELVGVLGVTKATAGEVNARLAAASEARKRISDACEEYRPVAHRAQLLYFLIAQFSTVNAMYQTSLAQARAPSGFGRCAVAPRAAMITPCKATLVQCTCVMAKPCCSLIAAP